MISNNFKLASFWCISIALIFFVYGWVDRDLATFIYDHHWRTYLTQIPSLKKIIEWPSLLSPFTPIIFFILLFFLDKKSKWKHMLLSTCLSIFLVYLLKNDLKWVFSRYWPETWINGNLSWINNHAYGFQWFQGKPFAGADATGSFPSGHSSVAFATLVSIGLCYRKWLNLCVLLAGLEALSMVAFNYHFLSDIIAGACLGTTCAILCYRHFFITKHPHHKLTAWGENNHMEK